MTTPWIVACAIACAVLVGAEYADRRLLRIVAKCAASTAFVIGGALAYRAAPSSYGLAIVVGLVLGALGDVALLGKSDRSFLLGLVAFLAGHVAYVIAFADTTSVGDWLHRGAPGFVIAAILVARWLWPHAGRLRGPVVAYIAMVTAMAIGAIAAARTLPFPRGEYAGYGGLAFYLSDLTVAREKFIARGFGNKLIGLPLYYAGQVLIAASIA